LSSSGPGFKSAASLRGTTVPFRREKHSCYVEVELPGQGLSSSPVFGTNFAGLATDFSGDTPAGNCHSIFVA
jgi:hypothetical protein